MLDTKGPEIRTGYLVDGKAVTIEKDSIVKITTDYSVQNSLFGLIFSRLKETVLISPVLTRIFPRL